MKVIDGKDEALISIVESDNKIHVKVSKKNPEKTYLLQIKLHW